MSHSSIERVIKTVPVGEFVLTVRDMDAADQADVLTLHTLVFGPEVDESWFAWKYGELPGHGQGQAIGAWHENQLIAYCGGVPRMLWCHSEELQGLQMGDVMVHPAWRAILTRRGPFFHVTHSFHESRIGPKPGKPFQVGFGFPNERALKLPEILGLVWNSGTIETLHWRTSDNFPASLPWSWHWGSLTSSDSRFDIEVNSAWKIMRDQSADLMMGQRDSSYVQWRYKNRPKPVDTSDGGVSRYQFFGLRRPWLRQCIGVAVLDLRSESALWLDWIGPVAMMPLACLACRLEAGRAGATELKTWASQAVALELAHTDVSYREVCSGLAVSAFSDMKQQDVPRLNWWLMSGDTDFL